MSPTPLLLRMSRWWCARCGVLFSGYRLATARGPVRCHCGRFMVATVGDERGDPRPGPRQLPWPVDKEG